MLVHEGIQQDGVQKSYFYGFFHLWTLNTGYSNTYFVLHLIFYYFVTIFVFHYLTYFTNDALSPCISLYFRCKRLSHFTVWASSSSSVLMSFVGLISQCVSNVLVGKESPGHLINMFVGTDGPEVLNVVPKVRGGVGPVGDSWWLVVRHWKHTILRISFF